jgi:hypothetical protein
MSAKIELAETISIREAGYDEYWLQDQISENPASLGLGELEAVAKERRQASGGRLDILLKNPEDDSMYEVEVMLGETDETHIIRTIEYWDNEKRRWPQRKHFAVLVAERINRRFFNVIHLLSYSIPIIAVQASLLAANGGMTLHFTKLLNTYEEVDDGSSLENRNFNRDYWSQKAKWTLDVADSLLNATANTFSSPTMTYAKGYVAIMVDGYIHMRLFKRSMGKSLLELRIGEPLQERAAELLSSNAITYVRKPKAFLITVDDDMIKRNSDLVERLAALIKQSWKEGI